MIARGMRLLREERGAGDPAVANATRRLPARPRKASASRYHQQLEVV